MHRIMFVCHGNICRSTMAQFVMEDLVRRAGRGAEFTIDSAATSTGYRSARITPARSVTTNMTTGT